VLSQTVPLLPLLLSRHKPSSLFRESDEIIIFLVYAQS
jgi:hypothetical protein